MINVKKKTIKIKTAGTIQSLLTAEECAQTGCLKLEGPLSREDLIFLNELELDELDLKKTEIGDNIDIFVKGFKHIKSILFPDDITYLEEYTLSFCRGLEKVCLPAKLKKIGDHTFSYSKNLKEISIDANNQSYQTIDNIVYDKSGKRLCYCNESREGIFTVNKGIEKLSGDSFRGCSLLTKISLPDSLQEIGPCAFMECEGLTEIVIPDGVTTLKTNTFFGCSKLSKITLPSTLNKIDNECFEKCSSLTEIHLPATVCSLTNPFGECSKLEHIYVDSSNMTFKDIDGVLTDKEGKNLISYPGGKKGTYQVPNGIIHIKDFAFEFCRKLSNLIVDEGTTSIGKRAFRACFELSRIELPSTMTRIGDRAFDCCSYMTSFICKSVTPPQCHKNTFSFVNTDDCPLYVPQDSIEFYKKAEGWNLFVNIFPLSDKE